MSDIEPQHQHRESFGRRISSSGIEARSPWLALSCIAVCVVIAGWWMVSSMFVAHAPDGSAAGKPQIASSDAASPSGNADVGTLEIINSETPAAPSTKPAAVQLARSSADWPTLPLVLPTTAPEIQRVAVTVPAMPAVDAGIIIPPPAAVATPVAAPPMPSSVAAGDVQAVNHAKPANDVQVAALSPEPAPLSAPVTATGPVPGFASGLTRQAAQEAPETSQITCLAGCRETQNTVTKRRRPKTLVYSGRITPLQQREELSVKVLASAGTTTLDAGRADAAQEERLAIVCVAGCGGGPTSYATSIRPLNPSEIAHRRGPAKRTGVVVRRGLKRQLH